MHNGPVVLDLPFHGPWLARNSPARRVPSHGTHLFATTYAIDLIGVEHGRTARVLDWRTALATEPVDRFVGFGRPVLAPAAGTVATVHDGEEDHDARRAPLPLIHYALQQPGRVRAGAGAVAGNHVVLQVAGQDAFVLLAHLRRGSVAVLPGRAVAAGEVVGACGNSGNSTQPHLHLQVMDAVDPYQAAGVPFAFRDYRARPRRGGVWRPVRQGVPAESEVVERA